MQPDGQSDTPSVEASRSHTGVNAGTPAVYSQPVGQDVEVVSAAAANATGQLLAVDLCGTQASPQRTRPTGPQSLARSDTQSRSTELPHDAETAAIVVAIPAHPGSSFRRFNKVVSEPSVTTNLFGVSQIQVLPVPKLLRSDGAKIPAHAPGAFVRPAFVGMSNSAVTRNNDSSRLADINLGARPGSIFN